MNASGLFLVQPGPSLVPLQGLFLGLQFGWLLYGCLLVYYQFVRRKQLTNPWFCPSNETCQGFVHIHVMLCYVLGSKLKNGPVPGDWSAGSCQGALSLLHLSTVRATPKFIASIHFTLIFSCLNELGFILNFKFKFGDQRWIYFFSLCSGVTSGNVLGNICSD